MKISKEQGGQIIQEIWRQEAVKQGFHHYTECLYDRCYMHHQDVIVWEKLEEDRKVFYLLAAEALLKAIEASDTPMLPADGYIEEAHFWIMQEYLGGKWVQCKCGVQYEYTQDQVACKRCSRLFDIGSAIVIK